jgi:hypothetical protein
MNRPAHVWTGVAVACGVELMACLVHRRQLDWGGACLCVGLVGQRELSRQMCLSLHCIPTTGVCSTVWPLVVRLLQG